MEKPITRRRSLLRSVISHRAEITGVYYLKDIRNYTHKKRGIMQNNECEYIGRGALAGMLGVTKKAIEKWDSQRRIPGRVKIGRLVKYSLVEINKKLASGTLLLSQNK